MCDKKIAYEETFLGKYFFPHTFFFLSQKALKHHSTGHHGKKKKSNRKLFGTRYITANSTDNYCLLK